MLLCDHQEFAYSLTNSSTRTIFSMRRNLRIEKIAQGCLMTAPRRKAEIHEADLEKTSQ